MYYLYYMDTRAKENVLYFPHKGYMNLIDSLLWGDTL